MIRDVHHVGIVVERIPVALELFQRALGLPLLRQVDVPDRGVRVALLAVGASCLELVEPVTADSPFRRHLDERGPGLQHLGLWSDDVDAEVAALRKRGVPLLDTAPRRGATGRVCFLATDSFDGLAVEVVEPDTPADVPAGEGRIRRIDHVVLSVPDVMTTCGRFEACFGLSPKRTMESNGVHFAFLRPGDVIIEIVGPARAVPAGGAGLAGIALEVAGIDGLARDLRDHGFPLGDVHPAVQGGRIASLRRSAACGVPLAFIDFS